MIALPRHARQSLAGAQADLTLVALAGVHAVVLLATPTALVIGIGLWWNANTISHYFIHRPFFRRRMANRAFAALLSVLLGFPHALWRERHLAHHAGRTCRMRLSTEIALQTALVLLLWTSLFAIAPRFTLTVYLPGWSLGLLLCAAHGYYEHAHGTTSHYGRLYNRLLFNDGYHVEHHARPTMHWTELPEHQDPAARVSRWPAPLRWLESDGLIVLEHLAMRSAVLQRGLVRVHERAFRDLVSGAGVCVAPRRIAIVGGGLFPRTALALRSIWPNAKVTIIDSSAAHLDIARARLHGGDVEFIHARFPERPATSVPGAATSVPRVATSVPPELSAAYDLIVVPLSFDGDREAIYARPPAGLVVVHDWLWRRRGVSCVVSWALLKRINLVSGTEVVAAGTEVEAGP